MNLIYLGTYVSFDKDWELQFYSFIYYLALKQEKPKKEQVR